MEKSSFSTAVNISMIISMITLIVTIIKDIRNRALTRKLKMAEMLQKEEARFYSDDFKKKRFEACHKLIKYIENPKASDLENFQELDEILELLASLSIYYKHKIIDIELIYDFYSYYIIGYWLAGGETYVENVSRRDYKYSLKNLELLAKMLIEMREKREKKPFGDEDALNFLNEEIRRTKIITQN